MNDSYLLYHEQCPSCAKLGRDNSKDNLGVYSDGHTFCFSCKYGKPGNKIKAFLAKKQAGELPKEVMLPSDATNEIPQRARAWLEGYEFTYNTIVNNHIMWSEYFQQLIFPYFVNGVLAGWQGRCFNPEDKRKWFSQGKLDSFIYTRGKQLNDKIILTESAVSAIKVGRYCLTSPIFGSTISPHRWLGYNKIASHVYIWYDPDKHRESVVQAKEGRLYVPKLSVILTKKKPKDYSYEEIEDICQSHNIGIPQD